MSVNEKKTDESSNGTGTNALTPILSSDFGCNIKDLIHSTQENDIKIIGLPVNYETSFQRVSNGIIYGWQDGNTITLTPEGINPNTPVHQYTHLGSKAVQKGMLASLVGVNPVPAMV